MPTLEHPPSRRLSVRRLRRSLRAGLALLLLATCASPAGAQLARQVGGEWGPVIAWPHVAVSMALLPDGRVLTFASNERDRFPSGPEFTYAATWDPDTGAFLEIPHPAHDMFCASLVMLEDGSVFVSGGRNKADSPWTSLYDFRNDAWIPIEDMNRGRWYPTSVALPTGQVMIAVGDGGEQYPEIWTPGVGWQLLTGIDLTGPILSHNGLRDGGGLWPLLQLDPRGEVFHHGATPIMHSMETTVGLGSITVLGPHGMGWFPDEGVSVLFDEGMILVAGGSLASNTDAASDQAVVIDINAPAPVVTPTSPMQSPRQFHNEILLPNGDVLVVGGNTDGVKFDDDAAVLAPEVWDPDTGTWTLLNPHTVPRTYHSTATLLFDGRVLSAGGGLSGSRPEVNHWDGEVFSPPYLFAADGSPAVRPEIFDTPQVLRVGRTFDVEATPGLAGFSLVKLSATTHTMNTDLRFLRPSAVETTPGTYSLSLHANENVLTPGYWMLFALDASGTPSVAEVVQIVVTGEPRAEPLADRRNHVGEPVLLQLVAEDPDGLPLAFAAAGLPTGLTLDPASGRIQGVTAATGIFNVTITVSDGSEMSVVAFQWFVSAADSEVGTISIAQSGPGQWHTVTLQDVYVEPVVVVGPPSFGDSAPLNVRVRNVTPSSFEVQLDEWDYLDGAHGTETVSYLVVESGAHQLPGGAALVAERAPGVNQAWRSVALTAGAFTAPPVVLAQVASGAGSESVAIRMRNVDASGFEVRLQEEELGDGNVAADDVHWIAVEPAYAPGLFEASGGFMVDENADTVTYTAPYPSAPHLLATMQTITGNNPAALRHDAASPGSVDFFVEEEQSDDNETGHTDEEVGWMAIDPLVVALGLTPLFNAAPTVADPGPQSSIEGEPVSLLLLAADDDGDGVAFSATGLPAGLALDPVSGEISGAASAPGTHPVTVTVTDPSMATGQATFDWTVTERLRLVPFATPPQSSGAAVTLLAMVNISGVFEFTWDFGDGSGVHGPFSTPSASHVYPGPGRYVVTVSVLDPASAISDSLQFVQMVHAPPAGAQPTASSSVAYESATDRVWVANPDNDSVAVVDAATNVRVHEVPVCTNPRSVAVAGDGRVWVACKGSAGIDVIDPAVPAVVASVPLTPGSRPHGLAFDPAGAIAFVALEATGDLLRLDGVTGAELGRVGLGPWIRHVAVSADGATVYAPRFVTPPLPGESTAVVQTDVAGVPVGGELLVLDAATLAPAATIVLQHSDAPSTELSGPGIPNYVGAPALSPDGARAWIPSKQDNVKRGLIRDGLQLVHDSTVRAITSRIDLVAGAELLVSRVDHDDASIASASLFDADGAYLFTALEGNREVAVVNGLGGGELGRFPAGRAPQGLARSSDGRTLYVHNFMDRTLTVHDLSALLDFDDANVPTVATVALVASEALAPDVLNGKQLFYDAQDQRLALQGYMACAACHNEGGQDGRVWDFTQFGEGLRNTISLAGAGVGHGPVHWTANFDEIQDFEGQIRLFGAGLGLMTDAEFNTGTRADPLGDPKAGVSVDLDALAAYVASLTTVGPSPHRAPGGALTPDAAAGRVVYGEYRPLCAQCHSDAAFTDSAEGVRHGVGTIRPTSGPETLRTLDTPTLRGLWTTGPYLHDGSAPTIADAIDAHQGILLHADEVTQLSAYLTQIDDAELAAPPALPVPEPTSAPALLGGVLLLRALARRRRPGVERR